MINLKLLTNGLKGVLTPSEFMTLFVIESALGKTNDWKKIYNEMIADLTNLSISQVKRNIASLVEKEFICKRIIQLSRTKRECLYRLNLSKNASKNDEIECKNEQKNTNFEFTGEPLNNLKQFENNLKQFENNIKQLKTIEKNIRDKCENPMEGFSTYPSEVNGLKLLDQWKDAMKKSQTFEELLITREEIQKKLQVLPKEEIEKTEFQAKGEETMDYYQLRYAELRNKH